MNLKLNTSFHKTTSKGTEEERKAYSLIDVSKWISHNERRFEKDYDTSKYTSLINQVFSNDNYYLKEKDGYKTWFNNQIPKEYIDEFNSKHVRNARKIKDYDYFEYAVTRPKTLQAIAEQIIISIGSKDEFKNILDIVKQGNKLNPKWKNLWQDYTNELKKHLKEYLPDFKLYSLSLHLDETTPHVHVVGVPLVYRPNAKKGIKFRISNRSVFNPETLPILHQQFRQFHTKQCQKIEQFLEEENIYYDTKKDEFVVAEKKKWRHEKITVTSNQESVDSEMKMNSRLLWRAADELNNFSKKERMKYNEKIGVANDKIDENAINIKIRKEVQKEIAELKNENELVKKIAINLEKENNELKNNIKLLKDKNSQNIGAVIKFNNVRLIAKKTTDNKIKYIKQDIEINVLNEQTKIIPIPLEAKDKKIDWADFILKLKTWEEAKEEKEKFFNQSAQTKLQPESKLEKEEKNKKKELEMKM